MAQQNTLVLSSVTDIVIRYSLGMLLIMVTCYDVMHWTALAGYLSQISLPGELLFTIIGAQIVGVIVMLTGIRTFLSAVLLAVNCAISAECFNSIFSWVLMAGFLVLAIHCYGRGSSQRYCDPLIK